MLRIGNTFLRLLGLRSDKEEIDTTGRHCSEKAAQEIPTKERLALLEDWYRSCLEDPGYHDSTLHEEIIDEKILKETSKTWRLALSKT